jgi:hypothetical protein
MQACRFTAHSALSHDLEEGLESWEEATEGEDAAAAAFVS